MSRPGGNRKPLIIDRDALRDARIKAHKHERHGLTGFLLLLALLAAAGAVLWTYHGGTKPLPPPASTPLTASVQEPLPLPVDPVEVPEPDEIPAEPDLAIMPPSEPPSVLSPAVATAAEPLPTHDHLSSALLQPASRRVLLQIGRLDGYPQQADAPLAAGFHKAEYPDPIVRLNAGQVRTSFPQRITPGQSIVLSLDEMEPRNLLFRAVAVRRDAPDAPFDPTKAIPSLRILCNGQNIWARHLDRQGFIINALIPASYLEPYKNTLTLQNDGKLPVAFDALWIETARSASEPVRFSIRDWQRIPADYRGEFAWNREREPGQLPAIPSSRDQMLRYPVKTLEAAVRQDRATDPRCEGFWHYRNPFVAFNEQEKVALHFLEQAIGWYFQGGSGLIIANMTGPGQFFCTHTGRLYPSAYALWSISRVFEGQTRRLPVNVLPTGADERPLDLVYWMGTQNQDGVASIIVANSRFGRKPGKVRVVCALPWQGPTMATVYNGVFPEAINMDKPTYRGQFIGTERQDDPAGPYDRSREDKRQTINLAANGQGGLLDGEWDLQDCLYIRLVQQGASAIPQPETPALPDPREQPGSVTIAGDVSESREIPWLRRKPLPVFPGVMQPLCANYRIKKADATRATIAGLEHVVPDDPQSLFCEISYSEKPRTAEGAALSLYPFHEAVEGKALSFWVYPHTKRASRTVQLRMGLGAWEGRVTLKPGKWQRVEMQFENLTGEPQRQLVLLGPSFDENSGREEAITFEFNGIALVDAAGSGGKYMDARPLADGRLAIVLLGEPGKPGSARHAFLKAVAVNTVTNANGDPLKWAYRKESQILDISRLVFPETPAESVQPYLNYTEKQHCRQGLTPVVLIAEIDT